MKYPIPQKVMLTSVALFASLALSAQAGQLRLSSANQTHGSNGGKLSPSASQSGNSQSWHQMLFPASTYMLDDGTAETAIGATNGGDGIALNEFAVLPGAETITTVSIAWGTRIFPDPSLDGLPYTVAVWSDPNGDGSPTDAVLLTTAAGVVASQGTDTFITTDIPDTTITTANFFVGVLITYSAGQFPGAFDHTPPTFFNRSYIAASKTPGGGNIMDLNDNDLRVTTVESRGFIGNWLIRADATGEIALSASFRHRHDNRLVALSWTPADGGTIDILRDGVVIRTVDDDGRAQDDLGTGGRETHVYQVCETDTGTCSNAVELRVPGSGGQ